jgi:ferric-dicitrate binding protein FerR (iron transport regulator)
VGTQFALAVNRDETRLRVREGSVHWLAAGAESTVEAGTEVVFNADQKKAERRISTSAADWDWAAHITPDFEIENRPLGDFLNWVARESGRKLILVDDQARTQAATIRMHGSVRGLTPMQALSAVMATTELRFDLPEGQIRVSFGGDTTPRK